MITFESTIPKNWESTTIGHVYSVLGGGTPSTEIEEYWDGDIPWVTSADVEGVRKLNIRRYVTQKGIDESTTTKVPPKTLLVVTRVGLGKIAITETDICFSQDLQGLVQNPDLLLPEYVLYYLSYELQILKFEGRGTTISGLTKKQLKDLGFPLPPLNEQRRIVAKIEALFSELDKGVACLKTARAQLAVYRQALLKHAFEGKLTEKWRKENAHKLKPAESLLAQIKTEREARHQEQVLTWQKAVEEWEAKGKVGKKPGRPQKAKSVKNISDDEITVLPELPDQWFWLQVGENNVDVFDGPFGSNLKTSDYVDSGVRVIRLENIGSLEFIDEKKSCISEQKFEVLKRHTVSSGDIVFSSFVTERIRVALIPKSIKKAINKADCFCIRTFGKTINNRYLSLFLSSRLVFKEIEELIHGVGRPRINTSQLKGIWIPQCSIDEQTEVTRRLDRQISDISQLENDIDDNIIRADALRQSILKKAFSGQLVPQDPNDEPAAVLLERIKAQKAKTEDGRKRRKSKQSQPTLFPPFKKGG